MTENIDWSPHDKYSEAEIECACSSRFRSHNTFRVGLGIVTRKPCPACGSTTGMLASRSDWEPIDLKGSA